MKAYEGVYTHIFGPEIVYLCTFVSFTGQEQVEITLEAHKLSGKYYKTSF
jgi:hypothetical protein